MVVVCCGWPEKRLLRSLSDPYSDEIRKRGGVMTHRREDGIDVVMCNFCLESTPVENVLRSAELEAIRCSRRAA